MTEQLDAKEINVRNIDEFPGLPGPGVKKILNFKSSSRGRKTKIKKQRPTAEKIAFQKKVAAIKANTYSNVEEKNGRVLIDAVDQNNLELVKQIMGSGTVDPNYEYPYGNRNLIYQACDSTLAGECLPMVEYLVGKCGADPSLGNERGTPLHNACKRGYLKIVKYLVEKAFVDINAKTESVKYTPFLSAIAQDHIDIAAYLLDCKSLTPETRNEAFKYANEQGACEIVDLFDNPDLRKKWQDPEFLAKPGIPLSALKGWWGKYSQFTEYIVFDDNGYGFGEQKSTVIEKIDRKYIRTAKKTGKNKFHIEGGGQYNVRLITDENSNIYLRSGTRRYPKIIDVGDKNQPPTSFKQFKWSKSNEAMNKKKEEERQGWEDYANGY